MSDIPIIFSAPMVRALLEGRKTMTRRLARTERTIPGPGSLGGDSDRIERPSPWQKVKAGDRLWVRERHRFWQPASDAALLGPPMAIYAEGSAYGPPIPDDQIEKFDKYIDQHDRPSIFMPRWASRLTLIVMGAKIERLQDISKADVIAEGIHERDGAPMADVHAGWHEPFANLWISLHGAESWDANPEVVAISFRVMKANIDAIEAKAA